jgi:ribosome-binding protein aMBF1 (putative translation factor)
MGKPQIIRTEGGEELVVIPLSEYEELQRRADDNDAEEDEWARRVIAESDAAIARGDDVLLPLEVWRSIDRGDSAVRVLRKHRGLTQAELAAKTSITQAFLSEIERGRKVGTTDTLKSLAKALAVPLSVLVE